MTKPALRILRFDELERMYNEIKHAGPGQAFFQAMIERLNVDLRFDDAELSKIPAKGPVVVVANHPFGILEGAAILSRLLRIRPDVKALTNSMLTTVPEAAASFIPVDVISGKAAMQQNQRGLRQSLEWLKRGGVLLVFPAGEVSHLQWNKFSITDPEWSTMIARLIRRTGATAVPVFVRGANSLLFQILGLVHPKLRTALLPHEYLNKENSRLEIRAGAPIPPERMAALASDEKLTRYLRWRTYLLEHRHRRGPLAGFVPGTLPAATIKDSPKPRVTHPSIRMEVEGLPPSRCLIEQGDTRVYVASAREMPRVLDEIGELREITFRAAGEGTGKARDLDEYELRYLHLFSWDVRRQEVIGAYRLGQTDEILRREGIHGLYTSTLFHYNKDFLLEIHPALEMGRSFIRAEYQKSFSALLLLWKGIGRFVVAHPRYRVLFGPVSISNDYHPLSRKFLVDFLQNNLRDERLARMVKPRKPFRPLLVPPGVNWSVDLEELSDIIGDLERDGKGLPVLLRQYLKLGGRLLSFNVDPKFSRCLDGLVVVDLARTERAILNRYMTAEGAEGFLRFHRELVA